MPSDPSVTVNRSFASATYIQSREDVISLTPSRRAYWILDYDLLNPSTIKYPDERFSRAYYKNQLVMLIVDIVDRLDHLWAASIRWLLERVFKKVMSLIPYSHHWS
ncbi:hypothetical protein SFRURICE_016390 [Spodoptera frugiperda]|nr:hypothetical protein SFRURICE_016390 [Spodoptera frugiperda]